MIEGADEIDHEQIDQAVGERAVNMADQWITLAHAQTLLLLEEREAGCAEGAEAAPIDSRRRGLRVRLNALLK